MRNGQATPAFRNQEHPIANNTRPPKGAEVTINITMTMTTNTMLHMTVNMTINMVVNRGEEGSVGLGRSAEGYVRGVGVGRGVRGRRTGAAGVAGAGRPG